MRRPAAVFVALVFILPLAVPAAASAGAPGHWDRFSTPTGAAGDEPGLARTADNVLHVVWLRRNGGTQELWHTPIAANGTVGASSAVQTGWSSLASPALVTGLDGLTLNAFWGGVRSTNAADPYKNLNYAYSSDGGAAWTLWPGGPSAIGGNAYTNGLSAARLSGTFFESWAADVHRGVDTTSPVFPLTASPGGGCCGYDADVAADPASGAVLVAWYSSQPGYEGIWTQSLDAATGQPLGTPARMPRSATTYRGQLKSSEQRSRTPLVAHTGGSGFVVAYPGGYPATTRALVWRAGAARALLAGSAKAGVADVGLAAAPGGRVWAFWAESPHHSPRIVARRSTPDLSAFGAPVTLTPPKGVTDVSQLDGNAQGGPLDLVASLAAHAGIADWHTQLLPGLSVSASRGTLSHGARTRVIVTVTDAGTPIHGAKVRDGSKSGRTHRDGAVALTLGPFSRRAATTAIRISATGYAGATIVLRLRG